MREAGLAVTVDGVGNVFGRLEGADPSLPAVYAGSHLDAVPGGGRYDGPLGVMAALEAARAIRKRAPMKRSWWWSVYGRRRRRNGEYFRKQGLAGRWESLFLRKTCRGGADP